MRTATLLIILSIIFVFSSACIANQTLTITLEPTKEQTSEKNLELNRVGSTPPNANTHNSNRQYTAQTQQTQTSSNEVTVGRVGIIIAEKADIKSKPNTRSRALFNCAKDTYLAIIGESGNWYSVLMIDSSVGWIEKKNVNLLDYQVMGQLPNGSVYGSKIVQTSLQYLGIPYVWGGYSATGLDCSGFVKAVFASHGINLPRVSRDQAKEGVQVRGSDLQPGDRLHFATKGRQIDHVGIYIGNGLFIHASRSGGGVVVDSLANPFYRNSLVVIRRS